jgi:hypothetical protein
MQISAILNDIDLGKMALPEFQRGYVWNREQVRGLMESLYRRYPVGGLLIWTTRVDHAKTRGTASPSTAMSVDLLLDGQQRMTSLYGIMLGKPPRFFEGNASAFTGLYFNMAEETFEFYAPLKMQGNPTWVDVSRLMRTSDVTEILEPIQEKLNEFGLPLLTCLSRLNRIQGIKTIDLHLEHVSGEDMTIDVVVQIFNRVNSGGTTLSKGDLALAKLCAAWPEARREMNARLTMWRNAGYSFKLEWFLRCITAVTTSEALFSALAKIDTPTFQEGVIRTENYVNQLLNTIAGRLGLDHGDVLGSPYSLPLLCRYLEQHGGKIPTAKERDKLLYWYIHSYLWGRYAGSTESVLSQDLRLIDEPNEALDRLIAQLRQNRGDLRIQAADFRTWSRGSRFYPLLYMLTRVDAARDLDSGLELRKELLGNLMRLELHHIFPKSKLYKHGYERPEVNALGNFMFLTQQTNLAVTNRDPEEYFTYYESRNPGVLASQWVPTDPLLWKYENYRDFLDERRRLLAEVSNNFLDSLIAGTVPEPLALPEAMGPVLSTAVPVPDPADEETVLLECNEWVIEQGLPEGEFYVELLHPDSTEPIAMIDLAWPEGLQPRLSQPVALLLDEESETEEAVNKAGYLFFTNVAEFQEYVNISILATHMAAD